MGRFPGAEEPPRGSDWLAAGTEDADAEGPAKLEGLEGPTLPGTLIITAETGAPPVDAETKPVVVKVTDPVRYVWVMVKRFSGAEGLVAEGLPAEGLSAEGPALLSGELGLTGPDGDCEAAPLAGTLMITAETGLAPIDPLRSVKAVVVNVTDPVA